MSRRVQRVPYHLDTKGIRSLPHSEVRMILRGADDLIRRGGRHLLTLILYKKVRARIRSVIRSFRGEQDVADSLADRSAHERNDDPQA